MSYRMSYRCSTPFGICDEDIPSQSEQLHLWLCAQRLSASVMKTLPKSAAVEGMNWCSTPFGICDEDIVKRPGFFQGEVSAQRLSASVMKT